MKLSVPRLMISRFRGKAVIGFAVAMCVVFAVLFFIKHESLNAADVVQSTAPCSFPVLENGTEYSVGSQPSAVTFGDLNNDGKNDIVSANYTGRSISVLVSSTTGFQPTVTITNGCLNTDVQLGDLDSDGNLDAVVAANCQTDGSKILFIAGMAPERLHSFANMFSPSPKGYA